MKRLFAGVVVFTVLAAVALVPAFASVRMPRGPLSFGMHRYEQRSQLNTKTSWKCEYPIFEHSPAGDSINAGILKVIVSRTPSFEEQPVAKTIEEAAAAFIKEAEESQRGEKENVFPWESEVSGQVLLDQPGIVTVSIHSYTFTGGAHGMSVTSCLVFDTHTGKQLTLDDLFISGYQGKLDRLIGQRYRQMRGMAPDEPLNGEKGGLFEDRIAHNDNFALTGSGIRFLYNQYDIAPYAAGQIEIELPFSNLRDILKPLEAIKPLFDEHPHQAK